MAWSDQCPFLTSLQTNPTTTTAFSITLEVLPHLAVIVRGQGQSLDKGRGQGQNPEAIIDP
jgi:hypothetical protein